MRTPIPHLFSAVAALPLALTACQEIRTPGFEPLAPTTAERSVNPGINDAYLAADIDVGQWSQRFEVETREIYHERAAITRAVSLDRGQAVADIGAGTGLFLEPFARAVGPAGKVYALDIVPAFVDHMNERAASKGLRQVEARLCSEDSIDLTANSIDIAFICDVYHHFEYPHSTMTSIHRALRPGGRVVVIDFERIPGVSRPWILDHVRADKQTFTAEIEAAGFKLAEEVRIDGFQESYFLEFIKR